MTGEGFNFFSPINLNFRRKIPPDFFILKSQQHSISSSPSTLFTVPAMSPRSESQTMSWNLQTGHLLRASPQHSTSPQSLWGKRAKNIFQNLLQPFLASLPYNRNTLRDIWRVTVLYICSRIPGAYTGTTVATVYGPSRIQAVRADGVHVARPLNWKLANNTGDKIHAQWWWHHLIASM